MTRKIAMNLKVEARLYERFRSVCHRRRLYLTGVLRALINVYLRGGLSRKWQGYVDREAGARADVGGRGWHAREREKGDKVPSRR
jgi:hypothetical protein